MLEGKVWQNKITLVFGMRHDMSVAVRIVKKSHVLLQTSLSIFDEVIANVFGSPNKRCYALNLKQMYAILFYQYNNLEILYNFCFKYLKNVLVKCKNIWNTIAIDLRTCQTSAIHPSSKNLDSEWHLNYNRRHYYMSRQQYWNYLSIKSLPDWTILL